MGPNTIVVIEDDEYIQEAYATALGMEGYKVCCFNNGLEAMEGLKEIDRPALILLDWMMPVMNGREFLRERLREEHHSTPVVVISAQADQLGQIAGISACVAKPVDIEKLLSTVKEYGKLGRESA